MTQKELLLHARAKIEKGWCQHSEAQGADGCSVSPDSAEAVAFCILGAIPGHVIPLLRTALRARLGCPPWIPVSLAHYNDATERTKDEILSLFDEAITLAEEPKE